MSIKICKKYLKNVETTLWIILLSNFARNSRVSSTVKNVVKNNNPQWKKSILDSLNLSS